MGCSPSCAHPWEARLAVTFSTSELLTSCVASAAEGPGTRPGALGPVQGSAKPELSVITGIGSAVPHKCRVGQPVSHLSSLQSRVLPRKLPTGEDPPLALGHFACPMCPVLSHAVTHSMPSVLSISPGLCTNQTGHLRQGAGYRTGQGS